MEWIQKRRIYEIFFYKTCTMYIDLAGLFDLKTELAKLEKVLTKTIHLLQNLEQKVAAQGYVEKVKEEIKVKNADKIKMLKEKMTGLETTIGTFLKLEEAE